MATTRESADLWRTRLAVEAPGAPGATEVIERWLAAMPGSIEAHEMRMADRVLRNDAAGADETAAKILALEPGRYSAELRTFQRLLENDPAAAVARCESLLPQAQDAAGDRHTLRLGFGRHVDHARAAGVGKVGQVIRCIRFIQRASSSDVRHFDSS